MQRNGKIAAVGPNLSASDAMIVDAAGQLVIPGLIDTHRHTWETQLRGLIPEGDFFAYLRVILQTIAPRYRPEDVYLGNLLGSLGALDFWHHHDARLVPHHEFATAC